MNAQHLFARSAQLTALVISVLFLSGCSVRIDSIDQQEVVTVGEHVRATLDIVTTGPGDGGTHIGNMAVLIPEDWSIEAMDLNDAALSLDLEEPTAPTSTPSGYKWSFWHTALDSGGSTLHIDEHIGTTTGTYVPLFYPGITHCNDEGAECESVVWHDPVSQEVTVTESFSGPGLGTNGAPYKIITCGQLQLIERNPTAFYQLKNDIDCAASVYWNDGQGFTPIAGGTFGFESFFTGSLNGDAHSISQLTIHNTSSSYVGLFGVVYGGIIQNFTLDQANITAYTTSTALSGVGGVAGIGIQPLLRDVHVINSTIQGGLPAGGLIGFLYNLTPLPDPVYTKANIAFSHSENSVIQSTGGAGFSGGLIGLSLGAAINDSYSSSTVFGATSAGGLFGALYLNQPSYDYGVIRSYAAGTVSSTLTIRPEEEELSAIGSGLGGLAGSAASASLSSSFSVASLFTTATSTGGGIFGVSPEEVSLNENYFDAITTGQANCTSMAEGDLPGCTGVNLDGLSPDYFKHTSSVAPFVGGDLPWDFDEAWVVTEDYPALRNLMVPPRIPTDISVTGDYDTTTTVSWEAPVFENGVDIDGYYIEFAPDADWSHALAMTVNASTTHTLEIGAGTMIPDTHYTFRVRAFHGGPYHLPVYGLASSVGELDTGGAALLEMSDVTSTVSDHSATIRWTTNIDALPYVDYSTDLSFGATAEAEDMIIYVRDHTVELTDLLSCTTYHFIARSVGVFDQQASSTGTFVTAGCVVDAPEVSGGGGGGGSGGGGTSVGGGILLPIPSTYQIIKNTPITLPSSPAPSTAVVTILPPSAAIPSSPLKTRPTFKRNLKLGAKGEDVKQLQVFLNTHGFIIAKKGAGSPGKETTVFGPLLAKALAAYQETHANTVLKPFKLKKGTGIFGDATRKLINETK